MSDYVTDYGTAKMTPTLPLRQTNIRCEPLRRFNALFAIFRKSEGKKKMTLGCFAVRRERSLLRRATGEPVGARAQPPPARRQQGRGGAPEAEAAHAKEPRLRPVVPL